MAGFPPQKKLKAIFASALLCSFLLGCSTSSPSSFSLSFNSGKEINPDVNGRPSPLDIHIYQLASTKKFTQASFFEVYHDAKAALGDDLLEENRMELKPQQVSKLEMTPHPQANHIGLLFAYHAIKKNEWKKILDSPFSDILITLDSEGFNIPKPPASETKENK
jgi:type VI secretion system protein VasD